MDKRTSNSMLDYLDSNNSGEINVISPWSLLNYIKSIASGDSRINKTWVLTGNSDWVTYKEKLTDEGLEKVSALLTGDSVTVPLNHELNYLDRTDSLSNYLTYAFYTGYLTFDDVTSETVSLRVPNKEVLNAWLANINKLVELNVTFNWADILESLKPNDESAERLEEVLQNLLEECASSWDLVNKENSYHMWILGLMSSLVDSYKVSSNREAGLGRFDIAVTPLHSRTVLRNYVFELKKSDKDIEKGTASKTWIYNVKNNQY
ncbi:PD-(D/E)XK nuclease domain-containing protein [Bacillus sp. DJP31]|uniref:PD-(D/E)XK nuclease domain-containing protein n=1 Tax=Bacillus sp. DJP31 TaxID=3409789 RepID=UPI003BB4B5E5